MLNGTTLVIHIYQFTDLLFVLYKKERYYFPKELGREFVNFDGTLRFLINVPGHLLIFRFLSDPPDLIRTPRLLIFTYLTDEVVLFSSTFTNCLSLCAPLIYQRYFASFETVVYLSFG